MAVDNLKDFSIMFIMAGLLFVALLTFAINFTAKNNPDALGNSEDKFGDLNDEFRSSLISTQGEGNALLNISAESDPEISNLGSRDSVASAYGVAANSGGFFQNIKSFFEWVIPGANGIIIMSVLGGIFAFLLVYYVIKYVRNGI